MKSPLRYPGGKTRAIKILKNYIPADCKEICSPFFGGGSFELYLDEQGIKVHGYDNFKPLVWFWHELKNNPILLSHIVNQYHPIKKETFYWLQNTIDGFTGIHSASAFYVLNRCSFSGSTLSGGMSPNAPRFTKKGIDNLENSDFNINVKSGSFETTIPKHNCLVFADPPYYINQALYGNKGDMHNGFNHNLLSEILMKRGNFIATYNDCPEIRELYKGCNFDVVEWAYGMNKSKKSNEVIITN